MARPVAADADATRRRILDTARKLFSTQGMGETSMRQIAKGAEVSLATVHHYYGSKAELFQTAIDAMYIELATLREELAPVLEHAGDLERAIRETIERTYAFVCDHRNEVRLLMRTVIGTGSSDSAKRETFLLPMLDQGSVILSQLSGATVERTRMTLLTLNHLVIRYALTEPSELAEVTGVTGKGTAKKKTANAHQRVQDHLVELVSKMLLT